MTKKTGKTTKTAESAKIKYGKADNCSEDCKSYEFCGKEGNLEKFVPGMQCTERWNIEAGKGNETGENTENQAKSDEKTGQDGTNTAKETPLKDPNAEKKPGTDAKEPEVPEPKRYVFPRQGNIKCPKCGLYETVATSTRGAIQLRRCTRAIPVCRHTFKITGTEVKIKSTDCKQDT